MINQQVQNNEETVSIDYVLTVNGEQQPAHTNNTAVVIITKEENGFGVNVVGEFSPNLHLNLLKALMANYYDLFMKHFGFPLDKTSDLFEKVLSSSYNTALVELTAKQLGIDEEELQQVFLNITEGKSKEEPCETVQLAMQCINELEEEKAQANESNESIQESYSEEASSVESSGVPETGTEETGSEAEGTGDTAKSNG